MARGFWVRPGRYAGLGLEQGFGAAGGVGFWEDFGLFGTAGCIPALRRARLARSAAASFSGGILAIGLLDIF
jgi:hypothetical protein